MNKIVKSIRFLLWWRVFNTIRHLQLRQAWYFFLRRGVGSRRVNPASGNTPLRNAALHPTLMLQHCDSDYSAYEFNFLNRTLSFPHGAMNWCPAEAQRLWRYNLHYFDFLRDPDRPLQQKAALIDDWIANNPQGSEPAWEPYTASLRIVNWCLFFWSLPQASVSVEWLRSLHLQARWLECNLELHILANHYFENIKAMLFAAQFFDDSASKQWLVRFQRELIAQLREQTLSDGGHYERSPQYHCILLEDYMDIYALLRENSTLIKHETLTALKQTINDGLHFLTQITTPDDDIPLFNDSASGAASRPSALFAKARALDFNIELKQTALINLSESGLFGWKSNGDYFLIDCGDIGPAYQPGHTHCDFLSFVLMINGQWIIVDSGVCEYEPGAMRQYARSTAAHNTITIDGHDQSEIWGEFRVGRRARRMNASIHQEHNKVVFEGAFKGFPSLASDIVHRRIATLHLDNAGAILRVDIDDFVSGSLQAATRIKTLLHFHPSLSAEPLGSGGKSVTIRRTGAVISIISSAQPITPYPDISWFCPEFGQARANQTLQLQAVPATPISFSYRIDLDRSKTTPEDMRH